MRYYETQFLLSDWKHFRPKWKTPKKPFQRMVYYLVLAAELNKIAHTKGLPAPDKRWAMNHKSDFMKNAFLIWQRCNFKNVHACVTLGEKNTSICIMRFRFDGIRGHQHREWSSYDRKTGKRTYHDDVKSYNHVGFSLHIPLNHVKGCFKPLNTWGEVGRVKKNFSQSTFWATTVLAKHYGIDIFPF